MLDSLAWHIPSRSALCCDPLSTTVDISQREPAFLVPRHRFRICLLSGYWAYPGTVLHSPSNMAKLSEPSQPPVGKPDSRYLAFHLISTSRFNRYMPYYTMFAAGKEGSHSYLPREPCINFGLPLQNSLVYLDCWRSQVAEGSRQYLRRVHHRSGQPVLCTLPVTMRCRKHMERPGGSRYRC